LKTKKGLLPWGRFGFAKADERLQDVLGRNGPTPRNRPHVMAGVGSVGGRLPSTSPPDRKIPQGPEHPPPIPPAPLPTITAKKTRVIVEGSATGK